MTTQNYNFRGVTVGNCCPVCERKKDCSIADEGGKRIVKCMYARAKGGGAPHQHVPAGMVIGKRPTRDGGFMYFPEGGVPPVSLAVVKERSQQAQAIRARNMARASEIWTEAGRWGGRGGEGRGGEGHERMVKYLRCRGLTLAAIGGTLGKSLRYHPQCHEASVKDERGKWQHQCAPAMVAKVVDHNGVLTAVHRTFLDEAGPGKRHAEFGSAKKMLGACEKRAIRLREQSASGVLVVAEGIETMWSCIAGLLAVGIDPAAWVGMSAVHLAAMLLPSAMFGRGPAGQHQFGSGADGAGHWHTVIIAADFNVPKHGRGWLVGRDGAGMVAARKLDARIRQAAPWVTVLVVRPDSTNAPGLVVRADKGDWFAAGEGAGGVDWNDVQRAGGELGPGLVGKALITLADGSIYSAEAARARAASWTGAAGGDEGDGDEEGVEDGEGGVVTRGVVRDRPEESFGGRGGDAEHGGGDRGGDGGDGAGNAAGGHEGDEGDEQEWKEAIGRPDVFTLPLLEAGALERARRYLWERHRAPGEARFRLVKWAESWWVYRGGRYQQQTDAWLRANVWGWLNGFATLHRDSREKFIPAKDDVTEVMGALDVDCLVRCDELPEWLPGVVGDGRGKGVAWGAASAFLDEADAGDGDAGWAERPVGLRSRMVFFNGVLDVTATAVSRRVVMLRHSPQHFTGTRLPFALDVAALQRWLDGDCIEDVLMRLAPKWMGWLESAGDGDPAWESQLRLMMGDTITLDRSLEKIFVVVGVPRAGKGIIQQALISVCGRDNVASLTLEAVGNDRFALAGLVGRSVCMFPDAALKNYENGRAALEILKSISGQDQVSVRDLHRRAISTRLSTRLWVFCNQEPDIRDQSTAFGNRLVMLPLRKGFLGKEDVTLKAAVPGEAAGIMLWCLTGAIDLARMERRHIAMCGDAAGVHEDYMRRSAPIKAFVDDAVVIEPQGHVTWADLHAAYTVWCEDGQIEPMGLPRFSHSLHFLLPNTRTEQVREGRTRLRRLSGCRLSDDFGARIKPPLDATDHQRFL